MLSPHLIIISSLLSDIANNPESGAMLDGSSSMPIFHRRVVAGYSVSYTRRDARAIILNMSIWDVCMYYIASMGDPLGTIIYVKITRQGGISIDIFCARSPESPTTYQVKRMHPNANCTRKRKTPESLQGTILYIRLQPRHGLDVCPPLLPRRHFEVPDRLGLRRRALEELLANGIGHGEDAG